MRSYKDYVPSLSTLCFQTFLDALLRDSYSKRAAGISRPKGEHGDDPATRYVVPRNAAVKMRALPASVCNKLLLAIIDNPLYDEQIVGDLLEVRNVRVRLVDGNQR